MSNKLYDPIFRDHYDMGGNYTIKLRRSKFQMNVIDVFPFVELIKLPTNKNQQPKVVDPIPYIFEYPEFIMKQLPDPGKVVMHARLNKIYRFVTTAIHSETNSRLAILEFSKSENEIEVVCKPLSLFIEPDIIRTEGEADRISDRYLIMN